MFNYSLCRPAPPPACGPLDDLAARLSARKAAPLEALESPARVIAVGPKVKDLIDKETARVMDEAVAKYSRALKRLAEG